MGAATALQVVMLRRMGNARETCGCGLTTQFVARFVAAYSKQGASEGVQLHCEQGETTT